MIAFEAHNVIDVHTGTDREAAAKATADFLSGESKPGRVAGTMERAAGSGPCENPISVLETEQEETAAVEANMAERLDRAVRAVREARSGKGTKAGSVALMKQAKQHMEEGNDLFKNGDMSAAIKRYSRAVDAAHGLSDKSSALTKDQQVLLATSLANRAQARLRMASDSGLQADQVITLAHSAADDCAYSQGLRHTPQPLLDKLSARAFCAQRLIKKGKGLKLEEEQAAGASAVVLSIPAGDTQEEESQPNAAENRQAMEHVCSGCATEKSKDEYSRNQWKKRTKSAVKCKACIMLQDSSNQVLLASTEPEPQAPPHCDQVAPAAAGDG